MEKIRVSIVSYLNSKPFLWGLESSPVSSLIDISIDIPSKVASKLTYGQADVGLIPVAALSDLTDYSLISDYCIGADGKVRTVVIASEKPLEEVDTILMDYQSRTSVVLTKVLAEFFWKRDYKWENTCTGFEKEYIRGKTAGIVIGDRVFVAEKKYPYICDLAEEWKKFTGMPFVFAVWASTRKLPDSFLNLFDQALEKGINSIPGKLEEIGKFYPGVDVDNYFHENISFLLDESKTAALKFFLSLAERLEPISLH